MGRDIAGKAGVQIVGEAWIVMEDVRLGFGDKGGFAIADGEDEGLACCSMDGTWNIDAGELGGGVSFLV